MIICILGRQPELGLAEIKAVYNTAPELISRSIARLDISSDKALAQANRLGSIVKIIECIQDDFIVSKNGIASLCNKLFTSTEGKLTIGISYYANKATKRSATNLAEVFRDQLKQSGRSVRLVPITDATLSTATILHNGLAHQNPKKLELNFIQPMGIESGNNSKQLIVGRTIFVQDIDAYTIRDRRRPRRDARNGMLPPKLAQTMVNLAISASNTSDLTEVNLLDPFCGTGVVLQEAALMGADVYGTDLNPDMVDNTKVNLAWLKKTHHLSFNPNLAIGDATAFDWEEWAKPSQINVVATETYLGRPYTTTPSATELKYNITACNVIISKFLLNISKQLPKGAGLCIGVPVWFVRDHINHLPCIKDIAHFGFTNQTIGANLIYHRQGQLVGRELLVLQKR